MKSERGLTKARHLFQAHFTAKLGHRVHDHQATDAFLQLAHVSLCFFSDCAAVWHVHQLLRFVAQLLAFYFPQALDLCLQLRGLFLQLGVLLGGIDQLQTRHLVTDQIQAVAQAFNFVLFDFFHDK